LAESLLARVISILEALVDAAEPVGPRALARSVEIDRSAVGRILQQLEALDVLTGENGKYEPGPRLFALGRSLSALDTLPAAATSVLSALVAEYDETSYVCVLHSGAAVFLYESQSSKPLRYVVDLGRPVPLHAGAAGRAILAGVSEESARELLEGAPLQELTGNTVSDIDSLLAMRALDVERGYSISVEERLEGGAAVAAPFFDGTGSCQGSIVLTAPLTRFASLDEAAVGSALQAAAGTLSSRLGATG
jgi:IclR family acetate operon transcriptional repressor